MSDSRIRVLSLNCWGLKYVAKNREERVEAIAHELASGDHDVIALQEIWVYSDYERVKERLASRLPYAKFYYSGALGAGLAIFTRFPIISTSVTPYSLNGAPIDVAAGDWFVGKAAASAIVLHPILGEVHIFNTHLFAKGGEEGPEFLRAHRLVGAWEFAKLARQAAELGRYVICLGDFNSIPPTLPMSIILDHASLIDAWKVTHPGTESGPAPKTAVEAIERFGITADSPLNTWSAGKGYAHGWGKRLDYCLYRQPQRASYPSGQSFPSLRASDCKVIYTGHVPGYTFSFSDHFGLDATLEIEPSHPDVASFLDTPKEMTDTHMTIAIQAWSECYRNAKNRSKQELVVFGVCLVALLAVIIGSAWLPHSWVNSIFIVFTLVVAWLATTMLYHGFLYGNWECNALQNAIEDMEYHRKGLEIRKLPRSGPPNELI
ncbi:inositol phosphorylsphingolipid-phospholipase C [Coprinopsis marcescibilis]|uniref:Inositol phosphorylsphingolipid-phospholipase C n=1 Tax=Coprinopsis marcescibilis TaxID=230819 RepID=A0A5C3LDX7_COPMA|nr:inositol phosphorylsphingolipid-phospholipase C [Coprinopsis marcescibilis]